MKRLWVCLLAAGIAACSGARKDDRMTIRDMHRKVPEIEVKPSDIPDTSREKIRQSYQEFLQKSDQDELRAQAMQRLADLALLEKEESDKAKKLPDSVDNAQAIKLYENLLKTYPSHPRNDEVLYQLGNAYELAAQQDKTLLVLERLLKEFPDSKFAMEAHFRRAEIYFSTGKYALAEPAYRKVMNYGESNQYYDKALFKLGWSLYQSYVYKESLDVFFQLLDRMIGAPARYQQYADKDPLFTAGNREWVDDIFRVVSLIFFANEQDATLADTIKRHPDKIYEALVFDRLGELYLSRNRVVDATDTYKYFIQLHPDDPQAVLFNIRLLQAYEKGPVPELVRQAKEQFVERFNFASPYWRKHANETAMRAIVAPYLKVHLQELARYYHALAQRNKAPADYQRAEHYYRLFVEGFTDDAAAPQMHFQLAESLNESQHLAEAAKAYEQAAYKYNDHPKAAEAGYAAVLAYYELENRADDARHKAQWRRAGIDSSVLFADRFPQDRRAGEVLTKSALNLYEAREYLEGSTLAEKILKLKPPVAKALQIKAMTVIAHSFYEQDEYAQAEIAYRRLSDMLSPQDGQYKETQDRLAAAVYKQGEALRRSGNEQAAFAQFQRVALLAPESTVAVAAQFDAATSLLAQKQWSKAADALEVFRSRYPAHQLSQQIPERLYGTYLQNEQWGRAAAELEKMALVKTKPVEQRALISRAADLYEKAGQSDQMRRVYQVYVERFPLPLDAALEARQKLADLALRQKDPGERMHWLSEIVKAHAASPAGQTDRTRYLAANAAFVLAEPLLETYEKVRLLQPMKTSMQLKKAKMQDAIAAYGKAADFKIAEITTASTFRIAQIYNHFGRALMESQRPPELKGEALAQYDLLLEEQAFPFEEKAIKLHEANASRVTGGIYDEWVRKSLHALSELVPARYAKNERSEKYVDALY